MNGGNDYSIRKIIQEDDPQTLVENAQQLAKHLSGGESTRTQVRQLFGALRQIEMSWPLRVELENQADQQDRDDAYRELVLFRPRLAYTSSKHPELKTLTQTIDQGIQYVQKDQRQTMQRLVQFFEATLAFFMAEVK